MKKLVEHLAVAHGKLSRYLPLAIWNLIKYHKTSSRIAATVDNNVDRKLSVSSMSAPSSADADPIQPETPLKNEDDGQKLSFTCYICRRVFDRAVKIRQHYVTSHLRRQVMGRFTASRFFSSPTKEKCLYCDHVALPPHMVEHVR